MKNPKKPKKTQKKPKKTQKNPLGWVFLKKPGFFPTLTLTICTRSSDPFYKVTYYIKWANQGWKKPGFFLKNPAQWVFLGFSFFYFLFFF